jgi:hypothetical protein
MATPKSVTEATGTTVDQSPDRAEQNGTAPYVPRTELGRRLMEIRARIEASGQPLLSWEELEQELDRRRGCRCVDE